MDRVWVDQWVKTLGDRLGKAKWIFFEPTSQFYARLATGDDADLQAATAEIGRHLELIVCPSVTYEWGLRIKPEVAGQIRIASGLRSLVQIPLFYVGKPLALGGILAHELMHEFLAGKAVVCDTTDELEQLTDLACIFVGLGKLVLNGTITDLQPSTGKSRMVGYLSPELKVYAFRRVNEIHCISVRLAREHLSEDAVQLLEHFP